MSMLGGMRPADVLWYRLAEPGWFATEGWSLTPETAGMARLMGKGPHLAPIHAFVRRRPEASRVLVGGRNLGADGDRPPPPSPSRIDGKAARLVAAAARVFRALGARAGRRPRRRPDGSPTSPRLGVAAAVPRPVPTAIEQFDLQSPGVTMWAFGRGFHEPELDNQRGRAWRWMSDEARARDSADGRRRDAGARRRVAARRTSTSPSTLEVWSGEAKLGHRAARPGTSSSGSASAPRASRPAGHAAPHHHADVRAGRAGRLRRPAPARACDSSPWRSSPACRPAETAQNHGVIAPVFVDRLRRSVYSPKRRTSQATRASFLEFVVTRQRGTVCGACPPAGGPTDREYVRRF